MNAEFKKWIMENSNKWSPEQKQNFLRMVKSEPERAVAIISSSLNWWAVAFTEIDCDRDPKEILEAYKEHFAAELATT